MPGYAIDFPTQRFVTEPLWQALKEADRPRTIRDLHMFTSALPQSISRVLRSWEAHGLVTGAGYPKAYRMSETGARTRQPPIVIGRTRAVTRTPSGRQRCWTAMGVLKRFDIPTLEIAAGVSHGVAQHYVNSLVNAGYIRVANKGCSRRGEHASYVLIRRTGPRAPAVNHSLNAEGRRVREVRDRNDGSRCSASPAAARAREVNHVA